MVVVLHSPPTGGDGGEPARPADVLLVAGDAAISTAAFETSACPTTRRLCSLQSASAGRVRRSTHGGGALAIRRAQEAVRGGSSLGPPPVPLLAARSVRPRPRLPPLRPIMWTPEVQRHLPHSLRSSLLLRVHPTEPAPPFKGGVAPVMTTSAPPRSPTSPTSPVEQKLPLRSHEFSRSIRVVQPVQAAVPLHGVLTLQGDPDGPLAMVVRPNGDSRRQRAARREASTSPPVPCKVVPRPSPAGHRKGAKFAALCPGPWRSRAGLSDTPLCLMEVKRVRAERAARALVALLQHGAARFILHDPAVVIDAASPEVVAERLTSVLSAVVGVSSLDAAASVLGRLLGWVRENRPETREVSGSHVHDFLTVHPSSAATITGLVWLRDWCGLGLPARGAAMRPHRSMGVCLAHDKESLSLPVRMAIGLETLAACHPSSPFIRGHAAGWLFLARDALRVEQSSDCTANVVVSRP
ncbi:MAG: hypothetical protein SGPRY_010089 [Prymnesium sp.]